MKKLLLLIILIVTLIIVELKGFRWIPKKEGEELLFFPSGKFVKGITSGFDNLFADFIWIRTGVYFGKHRLSDRQYPYLYHMLDVLTDLDKKFIPGYTLGAMLLSEDVKRVDLSMKLLDKGLLNNPERWEIPFVKAFIHYIDTKDYEKAGKWFYVSSLKEGAPDMTVKFATWTLASGGNIRVTLELWFRIYRVSRNSLVREKAIKGISKAINDQVYRFKDDMKRLPVSLKELKDYGYLPYIPTLDSLKFYLEDGNIIIEQE